MPRKAFLMQLNPGQAEEYQRRHNPIWPELSAVLDRHGVLDYTIFLDEDSGTLFAHAEIADEEQWASIAEEPICRQWWEHMAPLMKTNPDKSPWSKELKAVFDWPQADGG